MSGLRQAPLTATWKSQGIGRAIRKKSEKTPRATTARGVHRSKDMDSADMSKRAHWLLRLAAVAVIAAAAWLPRGSSAPGGTVPMVAAEAQAVHASVASR